MAPFGETLDCMMACIPTNIRFLTELFPRVADSFFRLFSLD